MFVKLTVLVCVKAFPQRVDLTGGKTDWDLADLLDDLVKLRLPSRQLQSTAVVDLVLAYHRCVIELTWRLIWQVISRLLAHIEPRDWGRNECADKQEVKAHVTVSELVNDA